MVGISCWAIQANVSWTAHIGLVVMITICVFPAQSPQGVDGAGIGVEVPEEGVPIVVASPLPELAHVLEVSQAGNRVPCLYRIGPQFRAVIAVVALYPSRVEVGHNPIEVDTQSHGKRQ